jgi:hypothetical protein
MKQEPAITVWRDGTWKVWGCIDAQYAETDPDWLSTIPLSKVLTDIERQPEAIDLAEKWTDT